MFGVYSNNAGALQQSRKSPTSRKDTVMTDYLSGLDLNNAVSDVDEAAKKATTQNLSRIAGLFLKELTGGLSDDPVVAKRQTDDMLVGLAAGNSVFAASTPTPAAPAPLALAAGSPTPAPVAPVAPATPSPEEVIGREFLARFAGHDIAPALDFLEAVRATGLMYENCEKIINAVVQSRVPGQMINYIVQLAPAVRSDSRMLFTDSAGKVRLQAINDLEQDKVNLKDDIIAIASAIKGTTVTFPASGTRPVIDTAIVEAKKLLTERTELVDAIRSSFGVSLTGSQTMTELVAAAKAAAASATTPLPTTTSTAIDLLAEIDAGTNLKRNASPSKRSFADEAIRLIKEALVTQAFCTEMATVNRMGGVTPDMRLPKVAHALLTVTAAGRRMSSYVVPAEPVI
jgi:hypothetical protein